jgi:hypothetical protein
MLPPGGRHKSDWCRSEVQVADYTLPLTRAGRLYAELYQERVRPALQWSWHHLPLTSELGWLRRQIARRRAATIIPAFTTD